MSAAQDPALPQDRASLTRSAAYASIATALFLIGLKGWAAWRTDSTAMLGSLADTALDLIASVVTLAGVWYAARPADETHRFGHGKAEALAAIVQVMLIAVSATGIAARAIGRLAGGGETAAAQEGIAVSVIAMLATLALLAWQRRVIRLTGSVAIRTDNVHYQSDLLLNAAVIAALVLDQYLGFGLADPLFGLAIAAWLLWGAFRAGAEAVDMVMDREWPEEKRARFLEVLARHPELHGVHDLRTRSSGSLDFVQFHASVDPAMTVAEAHRVMDEIEARLEAEFPGVEVLIHPDPAGLQREEGLAAEELLPGAQGKEATGG